MWRVKITLPFSFFFSSTFIIFSTYPLFFFCRLIYLFIIICFSIHFLSPFFPSETYTQHTTLGVRNAAQAIIVVCVRAGMQKISLRRSRKKYTCFLSDCALKSFLDLSLVPYWICLQMPCVEAVNVFELKKGEKKRILVLLGNQEQKRRQRQQQQK